MTIKSGTVTTRDFATADFATANLVSGTIGGSQIVIPEVFCAACGVQLSGPNFPTSAWAIAHDGRTVCFGCIAAAALDVLKPGETS